MKNLIITEKCIECGSCLGLGFSFLKGEPDGSISVKDGTLLKKDSPEYTKLAELCPVGAFALDETVRIGDDSAAVRKLLDSLKQMKGIEMPAAGNFPFKAEDYYIERPFPSGQHRYDYSSDRAAENAAMREFEGKMFSQLNNYILKIITEYRVKSIKKYYTAKLEEGSVYAKYNQEISEMLESINRLLGNKFPQSFCKISVMPDRDTSWKMLNKGELLSDEMISAVRSEYSYSASDYDCYWRTDYDEVYDGEDWRGRAKFKDKYCYTNVEDAFSGCIKDLKTACNWAQDTLQRRAAEVAGWVVSAYNEELTKVMNEKIIQIEKVL